MPSIYLYMLSKCDCAMLQIEIKSERQIMSFANMASELFN